MKGETNLGVSKSKVTLCIELALVIYFTYGNVPVSMLFSQIIPPWPSTTKSKILFFTSVSPLLPCMPDHQYCLSEFQIYALICSICLSLSDLLHCIIGSSFIHLIRTDLNRFLFVTELIFHVYTDHYFLIHLSADGHLGCFQVLVNVNSATMNIGLHVSLSVLVS